MRIVPICSSSKGNSTFIGEKNSGIVIDIGCSYKTFCCGLTLSGTEIQAVKAVLITHEHIDHVRGLLQLTKHTKIPIFASEKTLEYIVTNNLASSAANMHSLSELSEISAEVHIKAFRTPHDSVESVGYILDFAYRRIGFCTDLGSVTKEVRENITGCDTVFLEANYDISMLNSNTRYPAMLKKRIAGDHGHLSNNVSGEFSAELVKSGTTNLILGHLSQENNTPSTAYSAVCSQMNRAGISEKTDCLVSVAPVLNTDGSFLAL